jgi:hypothetical protein
MKQKPWIEHSKIKNLISNMDEEFFKNAIEKWAKEGYSLSKVQRHIETLVDIINRHGYDKSIHFLDKYTHSDNVRNKLYLRYGEDRVKEYDEKLKNRPKPEKIISCWNKEYWIAKGFPEDIAKVKVGEKQRYNQSKRRVNSYRDTKKKLKWCVDYWTDLGYNVDEANLLRSRYFSLNTLEGFTSRHGDKSGEKKYFAYIEKYKKSMLNNLSSRKSAGYVSKEGKVFFIRLYKILRKMGLQRSEIYFGIDGSREFFIRDNSKIINQGRFVDFCIPKLKLCIEYNGTFWHARDRNEWKNPFIDFEQSIMKDEKLKLLCEDRGFDLVVVWSDEDKNSSIDKIRKIVYDKIRF